MKPWIILFTFIASSLSACGQSQSRLDDTFTFRGIKLRSKPDEISGLVLTGPENEYGVQIFRSKEDKLSFNGVPLQSITYIFFRGRLCVISLQWWSKGPESQLPKAENFITSQYGKPTKKTRQKSDDGAATFDFLDWTGPKAGIHITNFTAPMQDGKIPFTSGHVSVLDVELEQQMEDYEKQVETQKAKRQSDGL